MEEISLAARAAFRLSGLEAQGLGAEFIDNEHVLLGILKSEDLLRAEGPEGLPAADRESMLADMGPLLSALRERRIDPKLARRRLRALLKKGNGSAVAFSGHRTDRCRAMFARAAELCGGPGTGTMRPAHLFAAALLAESPSIDALLAESGAERKELLEDMGALLGLEPGGARDASPPEGASVEASGFRLPPLLSKFGRDMTERARRGEFGPVIGRAEEIRLVAQILAQRKKNAPILVGDPGVGKTCIVEGLAREIVREDASERIRSLRIIEIDMGSMVAGTKHRGEFEERLEKLIEEAGSDERIVLFIDEIHTLVDAGGGGALNASNMLKPALARGEIKCIGATTTQEYRRYIEKDPALERRFQVVWVDEPSKAQAVEIIQGLRGQFEEHHGLAIPDEAILAAVELSMRYLSDFRLPDKAIDLLDQACSMSALATIHGGAGGARRAISKEDIARVVSRRCRVPLEALTRDEGRRLIELEERLGRRVMGQPEAIGQVAESLRAAKAGMRDPRKPQGVFLFLGTTGTGKTELAKALAEFLFDDEGALVAFDMSEYQEKHSSAKLIGAPPGYVGHDEEGILTSKLRSKPYCVLLFDEIEKAHPDVFDLFLQIFDEGRLTDARGRRVDFSEAIIILTSNLGCSAEGPGAGARAAIGFAPDGGGAEAADGGARWREAYERRIDEALRGALRPELINRIQKRVVFYPLDREAAAGILGKILGEANRRLAPRRIAIELSEDARDLVLRRGYSFAYGARHLQRAFEELVVEPLSRLILGGRIGEGQVARARAAGEALLIEPAEAWGGEQR